MRQARELKARLATSPGLTRDALAREVGLDSAQLTRRLRLADCAPEIQRHILALPPVAGRGLITERRLRFITRIKGHQEQEAAFEDLLGQVGRERREEKA